MSITAIVENGSIKLPPEVNVPDGTTARIVLEQADGQTLAERYAKLIGFTDELSTDLAQNHDHYLHGRPRSGRRFSPTLFSIWRCSTHATHTTGAPWSSSKISVAAC